MPSTGIPHLFHRPRGRAASPHTRFRLRAELPFSMPTLGPDVALMMDDASAREIEPYFQLLTAAAFTC